MAGVEIMSTLVCFALKEEAAPFHKIAAGRPGVFTIIVGIGRQNAEKSVRSFLNSCRSRGDETQIKEKSETPHVVSYEPKLVMTCGFAGGLNPDLKLGEVVFELSTHNEQLSTRLLAAGAKPATFFCTDRIATTVAEKTKLRYETRADAVEMESAAIHAVCAEKNIPCATVRVISDTASEDLPLDFNALAKPDKSLDFGKLFLAIAKSPGKIAALMELRKKTVSAAQQLANVLEKVVAQP
jgi:adenosylhomocysteine nucleosidase